MPRGGVTEAERRRVRFDLLWERAQQDVEWSAKEREHQAARAARLPAAVAMLDQLKSGGDLTTFTKGMEKWSRHVDSGGFAFGGMMFLNQLSKRAQDDPAPLVTLLGRCLSTPVDEADARAKMGELMDHVLAIREGGHPQPGRISYVTSFFWAMGNEEEWPVFWASVAEGADTFGWLPIDGSPGALMERYFIYRDMVQQLDRTPGEVERAFLYVREHPFVGLDPYIVERCSESVGYLLSWDAGEGAYDDPVVEAEAERNARTISGDLWQLGKAIEAGVADAVGRKVKLQKPSPRVTVGRTNIWRADGYLSLNLEYGGRGPAVIVWASDQGVAAGISPGWPPRDVVGEGWQQTMGAAALDHLPEGTQFVKVNEIQSGSRLEPAGSALPPGKVFIARWYADDEAVGRESLADEIVSVIASLRPLLDGFIQALGLPAGDGEEVIEEIGEDEELGDDLLTQAATELYLDEAWVREIVELLRDKRQLIFYGPPGTGKTFVAKRIARALAQEDDARWGLVQLHPSSSYEDFFEGYRPRTEGSQLTYAITPGPLARIAEVARKSDLEHVLVIDEINRANVPKVFGELLFLLEYRGEHTSTLYRERFSLSKNLYFIGTMNTADRSIALVDAALRRRFHFVPFYPDDDRLLGVLPGWLADNDGPAWVAAFLEGVNDRLADRFKSRDFQIGPSHFMVKDLDEARLRRVWDYSVYPLIEEQLYDAPEELPSYSFDAVMKEFGPRALVAADEEAAPPADETGAEGP
jgi:hypothetical protein